MEIKDKELHRIALTCIIYKNGKYLITRRSLSKKAHPGRWTVPGGGLNVDDYINRPAFHNQWYNSVTDGLRREVKEEVGLKIGKPEFLVDLTFIRPDGVPVLVLSYFAKYISGTVKLDDDTIDAKWITTKELKKYDLIEGIDKEIKDVENILRKRK
ncbi:NUDIX hydrolase [Candidatus Parcubacteria bacterium]|nr:NUDIX hydrolase [Candidatus Parcubacteria bacterium]